MYVLWVFYYKKNLDKENAVTEMNKKMIYIFCGNFIDLKDLPWRMSMCFSWKLSFFWIRCPPSKNFDVKNMFFWEMILSM